MTISIAFIGAGYMAVEHARALLATGKVTIAGVTGGKSRKTDDFAAQFACPIFPDIAALYQETHAQAVVLAVPELACRQACEQLFPYPWLALLEKPVGHNLGEAEFLLSLSQSLGRNDYVALNRRSYGATRAALAMLEETDGPRLIQIHDTQDLAGARAFGQPEAVVENYMFANSLHLVDYLAIFGRGDLVSIRSLHSYDPLKPHSVAAALEFSSGDRGVYVAGWDLPGPWYVTIANSTLRCELRPLEQLGYQRQGERKLVMVEPDPDDLTYKPGLKFQADQFLEAVAGRPTQLASLETATQTMRMVAAIYGRH
jgi:predicted dehydrogenase